MTKLSLLLLVALGAASATATEFAPFVIKEEHKGVPADWIDEGAVGKCCCILRSLNLRPGRIPSHAPVPGSHPVL